MRKTAPREFTALLLLVGIGVFLCLQPNRTKQGIVENSTSAAVSDPSQESIQGKATIALAISHPLGENQSDAKGKSSQDPPDDGVYQVEVTSEPTNIWFNFSVALTAALVLVGFGTLCILRRQTNAIEVTAAAAEKNASAALKNAEAIINSERAWITIRLEWQDTKGKVIEGSKGITLGIRWICLNDGKTIAWITEKTIGFYIGPSIPSVPDWEIVEMDSESTILPIPADGYDIENRDVSAYGSMPRTSNDIGIIYGIIRYRDIFGENHHTTFGYRFFARGLNELHRLASDKYAEYNEHT